MSRTRIRVGTVPLAIVAVAAGIVPQQSLAIVLGYLTGNDYMRLSGERRRDWLIGALDGMMAESVAVTKDPGGPWIGRCVGKMDNSQAQAIFEKEMAAKPESWHAPAAFILRASLHASCNST